MLVRIFRRILVATFAVFGKIGCRKMLFEKENQIKQQNNDVTVAAGALKAGKVGIEVVVKKFDRKVPCSAIFKSSRSNC